MRCTSGHREMHGGRHTPEYRIWRKVIERCYSPSDRSYARYGGRGILVCDRWRYSFAAFREDMGARPPGMEIDRIDNDGHYEPANCRWATRREQVRNSTKAKLTSEDVRQIRCLVALGLQQKWISRTYGVHRDTIRRIASGRHWA